MAPEMRQHPLSVPIQTGIPPPRSSQLSTDRPPFIASNSALPSSSSSSRTASHKAFFTAVCSLHSKDSTPRDTSRAGMHAVPGSVNPANTCALWASRSEHLAEFEQSLPDRMAPRDINIHTGSNVYIGRCPAHGNQSKKPHEQEDQTPIPREQPTLGVPKEHCKDRRDEEPQRQSSGKLSLLHSLWVAPLI